MVLVLELREKNDLALRNILKKLLIKEVNVNTHWSKMRLIYLSLGMFILNFIIYMILGFVCGILKFVYLWKWASMNELKFEFLECRLT
jgi:hypothetical protein